jgi:hypothetical protein
MKTTTLRLSALIFALGMMPMLTSCNKDDAEEEVETAPPVDMNASNDAVRVTEVDLGRSVGADKRINDNATTDDFGRNDTIYASVATDGTASGASLTARWTFQDGQVVEESSQNIASGGPAVTEFHIAKPDGWPVGKYKVEIKLNGQTVESKDFEVK